MPALPSSYLRTHRKRSSFSQDEVAFLLGCQSGTRISRYENLDRKPPLETALAYEAIFRVPARELFAELYQKVEKKTISRAQLLAEKLISAKPMRTTSRKLAVLRAISSGEPAPGTKRL